MSAFWHWFVVLITLGFIALVVWLLIATTRARVPSQPSDDDVDTTGHVWDEDLTEYNNPMPRWWLWLFYATIVFTLVYLVLYPGLGRYEGVLGWSQEGQYEEQMARSAAAFDERFGEMLELPVEELVDHPDAVRMGRNLYAHNCSTCHGSDARGARGYPDLTDDHWIWGGEPQQVLTSIVDGRRATMPPFGDQLGDRGVIRTAVYVQQLAGQEVDSNLAAAGRRLYEQNCAACHGPEGTGNIHLGAPDLTTGVFMYGSSLDALRETIRHGRQGVMPAHGELIGDARSRLITAYLLGLEREDGND